MKPWFKRWRRVQNGGFQEFEGFQTPSFCGARRGAPSTLIRSRLSVRYDTTPTFNQTHQEFSLCSAISGGRTDHRVALCRRLNTTMKSNATSLSVEYLRRLAADTGPCRGSTPTVCLAGQKSDV